MTAHEPPDAAPARAAAPDADQILMRRFQEGDTTAFEVLVHKYQGLVLSLVRRYLGSRSSGVEDVAQQVFIRVFRSKMTYRPQARVKTWLYSVTVNACLNEIRRLRSQKNSRVRSFTAVFGDPDEEGGGPALTDDASPRPASGVEEDEAAAAIQAAVDALPDQQRLALVLTHYHGCSYEEVAASMDSTIPAVKSLLTRARENLRKQLRRFVEAEQHPAPEGGS
ncbi:MAG: RNA polymerase sigma factor [Planctomycetota bacterium]|nr:RNA polymerase sigma factor [Planctomycetota bacterium]